MGNAPQKYTQSGVGLFKVHIRDTKVVDLTINKKSLEGKAEGKSIPLSGATFELWAYSPNGTYSNYLGKSIDNKDGTYTFKDVDANFAYKNYFLIKETVPPKGYMKEYYLNNDFDELDYGMYGGRQFRVFPDGTMQCYTLYHTNVDEKEGFTFYDPISPINDLTISKKTLTGMSDGTARPLSGARFDLWGWDNSKDSYQKYLGTFKDYTDWMAYAEG